MIKLSKSHLKRVISSALACTMTATMLHCFPDKHFLVNAEETNQKYPYTMFAASSNEGAITVNANNFCVNGNVATNGTIVSSGNTNINGTRTEQAAEEMLYIFDKIDSKYFTGSNVEEYTEDYTLEEMNININNPVEVEGDATLTGNININSALKALENVELYGEVKNTNDSLIFSKYGDIIIESQNVNLNGLVYAPFGDVVVTAQNLNLNNVVIIADTITFDCPSVNANYSNSVAEFAGSISEPLNIPYEEYGYLLDSDEDDLPDIIESQIGTDADNADTDGDELPDGYEVFVTGTDPTLSDTDSNGVDDDDEDFDGDDLTNYQEYVYGTSPWGIDYDGDNLSDGDEVNTYGTNPLEPDTDFDGLSDADEIVLGTNPNLTDTNGDGTPDGKEKFAQTYAYDVENKDCAVKQVIISMEGTGNLQNTMSVESVMNKEVICSGVVGLVGEPFSIETTSDFETATLSFKIDQTKLGDTDFNDLMFLWYDEDNYQFVELDTNYDETNSLVSIQTTHFSRYMIVDKYQWYEAWAIEFDYNPGAEGTHGEPDIYHNTVLAIDCSGSMDTYDRISIRPGIDSVYESLFPKNCKRIDAATEFIRNMNSVDKTSVVLFTDSANTAQKMTGNKEDLKLSLQNVTSSGGTNFYSALIESYNAFEEDSIGALYTNNRIILLSDGEDGNYSSTLSLLNSIYSKDSTDKRKSIKIYTIGLGSSYDSRLEEIANISHGEFFKAYTADDLVDIYTEIGIGGDFDTTDTDHDGLYDAVEAAGIRIQNGMILKNNPETDTFFSNPAVYDTDNDELSDGCEIDPTIRKKEIYWCPPEISENSKNNSYYFFMKSDPSSKDSDGDAFDDKTDTDPMNYDEVNGLLYQSQHKIGIGYKDGEIADDLTTNDFSSDDMMEISDNFKYQLNSSEEYLYADFKGLMDMFAIFGEGRDIATDLINTFINGTDDYINVNTNNGVISLPCYTHDKLKEKIYNDKQVQKYINTVIDEFSTQIQLHNGDVIKTKRAMQNIIEDSGTSHITFSRDSLGYLCGGMTLSINDLWGSSVNISTFEVEGNSYNGILHFQLYDHFGLDQPDVEKIYVNLAGFRAWFVLQHYDVFNSKYKPFINVFDYYVPFSGTLT